MKLLSLHCIKPILSDFYLFAYVYLLLSNVVLLMPASSFRGPGKENQRKQSPDQQNQPVSRLCAVEYLAACICFCEVMGHGCALAELIPFNRRVVGSNPTLGQVLNLQLPVALRREIPAQYPCCVGSASE